MAFASAVAFLLFAVWISSFVLAEMSDKTMLASLALASDHDWRGVWMGSTLGMVLADALAIAMGVLPNRRLPHRPLHVLASLLFLTFGMWMLFHSALGLRPLAIAVTAGSVLAAVTALATQTLRRRPTKASITGRSAEVV